MVRTLASKMYKRLLIFDSQFNYSVLYRAIKKGGGGIALCQLLERLDYLEKQDFKSWLLRRI